MAPGKAIDILPMQGLLASSGNARRDEKCGGVLVEERIDDQQPGGKYWRRWAPQDGLNVVRDDEAWEYNNLSQSPWCQEMVQGVL